MVCVIAALIMKALVYEFKWKHYFFKTFLKHFFKHDFRFKNLIFLIIHRVSAFIFQSKNMTPKNCLTCNFSPQYQYILQPKVWRIKKLISWTASNWRNTLFSKNISWYICYVCKGDLVRSWKLKAWNWVHHFILQTIIILVKI